MVTKQKGGRKAKLFIIRFGLYYTVQQQQWWLPPAASEHRFSPTNEGLTERDVKWQSRFGYNR